jgi:hypothetical protein
LFSPYIEYPQWLIVEYLNFHIPLSIGFDNTDIGQNNRPRVVTPCPDTPIDTSCISRLSLPDWPAYSIGYTLLKDLVGMGGWAVDPQSCNPVCFQYVPNSFVDRALSLGTLAVPCFMRVQSSKSSNTFVELPVDVYSCVYEKKRLEEKESERTTQHPPFVIYSGRQQTGCQVQAAKSLQQKNSASIHSYIEACTVNLSTTILESWSKMPYICMHPE